MIITVSSVKSTKKKVEQNCAFFKFCTRFLPLKSSRLSRRTKKNRYNFWWLTSFWSFQKYFQPLCYRWNYQLRDFNNNVQFWENNLEQQQTLSLRNWIGFFCCCWCSLYSFSNSSIELRSWTAIFFSELGRCLLKWLHRRTTAVVMINPKKLKMWGLKWPKSIVPSNRHGFYKDQIFEYRKRLSIYLSADTFMTLYHTNFFFSSHTHFIGFF